jgi:UDPglucose 6-dehydrogenase
MFNQPKVGFIGIGKLGEPCASVIARHYDLAAYDILPRQSSRLKLTNALSECVAGRDIIFVAVPTPHEQEYDGPPPLLIYQLGILTIPAYNQF